VELICLTQFGFASTQTDAPTIEQALKNLPTCVAIYMKPLTTPHLNILRDRNEIVEMSGDEELLAVSHQAQCLNPLDTRSWSAALMLAWLDRKFAGLR
jgi:hypothetical protein